MAQLVGSLNGQNIVEDYQRNASLIAVAKEGGVVHGLEVVKNGSNLEISSGLGLVKVKRGTIEFVVDVWNTSLAVINNPTFPGFVYFQVDESKVANGSGNSIDGTGIANIVFSPTQLASYPTKFHVLLAEVDGSGNVTDKREFLPSVQELLGKSLENAMYQSISTGTNLAYVADYGTPLQSTDNTPEGIAETAFYSFKAHATNNGPITLTLETSAGNLTAPVKKLHDQDLQSGDIEQGQTVFVTWNKAEGIFEMQSQLAQAPVGTVSTISSVGLVGDAEGITIGQPVFVGSGFVKLTRLLNQATGGDSYNFGNGNQIRLQQMITADSNNVIRSVTVRLRKSGSPTDNVQLRIVNENRTTVIASSQNVIAGGTITTSFVSYTFTFTDPIVTENGRFVFELIRTAGQDSSNFYQVEATGSFEYPHGDIRFFDGTNFVQYDGSLWFTIQFGRIFTNGQWYQADNEFEGTREINGIAEQTKAVGQSISVTMEGINNNQTGLIPGSPYFLDTLQGDKNIVDNTGTHFGHSVGNQEKIAQSIMLESGIIVDKIWMNVRRENSPIDSFRIRIETDNGDNPSGTLVHANAVSVRAGTSLRNAANGVKDIFLFNGAFTLVAGQKYWIVLERTDSLDSTNFYHTRIQNSNVYANGNVKTFTNSAWATQTWDLFFSFLEQYNGLDLNGFSERPVLSPNSEMVFGYSRTDRLQIAQMMMVDKPTPVSMIDLHINKVGNPLDSVVLTIETNVEEVDSSNTGVIGTGNQSDNVNIGTTTVQRQAFGLQSAQPGYVHGMDVRVGYVGVPTDGMRFRIETDNAGQPSGTLVHANAVVQIDNATQWITGGTNWYPVLFDKGFQLDGGTQYWLVVERTGSLDNVNYFVIGKWNVSGYTGALWREWNGTAWSTAQGHTGSVRVGVNFMRNKPSGELIHPNATITISNSAITTTYQNLGFAFGGQFTLPANTKFWIRLRRSSIAQVSTSNYYKVRTRNDNLYGYGYLLTYASGNWNDGYFTHTIVSDFAKVYRRKKYLRLNKGKVPVGKSILSNQIKINAVSITVDTDISSVSVSGGSVPQRQTATNVQVVDITSDCEMVVSGYMNGGSTNNSGSAGMLFEISKDGGLNYYTFCDVLSSGGTKRGGCYRLKKGYKVRITARASNETYGAGATTVYYWFIQ